MLNLELQSVDFEHHIFQVHFPAGSQVIHKGLGSRSNHMNLGGFLILSHQRKTSKSKKNVTSV